MDTPTTPKFFTDWAKLKIRLNFFKSAAVFNFHEREIWWVSLGQNIGSEANGKHEKFERPVVVLKSFNAEMFLAIPLSTQVKPGKYRLIFEQNGQKIMANVSQVRVISSKRLLRYKGRMRNNDFFRLQEIFCELGKG